MIQDRLFNSDGTLVYPSDPRRLSGAAGRGNPSGAGCISSPDWPTPTTHYPEFFGDIMLVNGKAWPKLDVEPRQYRFRVLNGSDSRVYTLQFAVADAAGNPSATLVPFFVIGNELGLLNRPAAPAYVDSRGIRRRAPRPNVLADRSGRAL
ncbi:MAG: hypothetical protein MZW92_76330 [Comamonadaceae bacterium]|nr:hypothetical protein [Comamonadaceae bacterium]